MRQGFTIEKNADEEIEVSTVAKSMKVRINAGDKDGDATEVELSLAQAKELRSALDKAITLADNPNPYAIYASTISAASITADMMRDYYRSYDYSFPQRFYSGSRYF